MTSDTDRKPLPDLGQKLAHVEGILGAYLPQYVFAGATHMRSLDCDKSSLSRLKNGKRPAGNWELARFIELYDLARHGFDYRLFRLPFADFETALRDEGVGSHGSSAAERLREALRARVLPGAAITIRRERALNIGGIGFRDDAPGPLCLTPRDRVTLTLPLQPGPARGSHLLLLHDFPGSRAMSCLMPSVFAPRQPVTGSYLMLPQPESDDLSFSVGGTPGYRCLYGIQSDMDLAAYIELKNPEATVSDIHAHQVAKLVDLLSHASAGTRDRMHLSFAEYLLK